MRSWLRKFTIKRLVIAPQTWLLTIAAHLCSRACQTSTSLLLKQVWTATVRELVPVQCVFAREFLLAMFATEGLCIDMDRIVACQMFSSTK